MIFNTTLKHVCPVCESRHIKTDWETTDENHNWWYTGHYVCLSCLTIYRASGPIRMGEPIVHAWHPACRIHGTDAVIVSDEDGRRFYCVKCGRTFRVINHKVEVLWPPTEKAAPQPKLETPVGYDHVFWAVTNRKDLREAARHA